MKNPVIPCIQNDMLNKKIIAYAETLKKEAHTIGSHGLSQEEFYQSGLFRGAIERIRGQFSASMQDKHSFVGMVLDRMQEEGYILSWKSVGESNRRDYEVNLKGGRIAVIELKGCLDGNNTNIFERPDHADEFIIWSICSNCGSNPRRNVWSGIHSRLGPEIISRHQRVDGLVVWDMLCGTVSRPCPKLLEDADRFTQLADYQLPPPCIYLFPSIIPDSEHNTKPNPNRLSDITILQAFYDCFKVRDSDLNYVFIEMKQLEHGVGRRTKLMRDDRIVLESKLTRIRRNTQ